MGRGIIKPKQDVDFYVEWSSIVDMPISWGTREFLASHGISTDRLDRADKYHTSYLDGYSHRGWDKEDYEVIAQSGTLAHSQLIEFCDTLDERGELTAASRTMLTPLED